MTRWKSIPGWPYEAGDDGRIRNARTGRVLRQQRHKGGYLNVQLWSGGRFWTVGVHQLVALAFIGPAPSDSHEVRHGDGVRTNNHLDNLAYGLHLENMRDRDAHGTTARGERNGKVKHSNQTVTTVLFLRTSGVRVSEIARMMGLHPATVNSWVSGRTRK